MRTEKVEVREYDPGWKEAFETIAAEIHAALDGLEEVIEHVGSTSVPGLAAKPIIDIDVVIPSVNDLEKAIELLERAGYEYEGNLGIKDREAFKYSGKEHLMTHHLYVCPKGSAELRRHIAFRDYLRSCPEAAQRYGEVKMQAAGLYPCDIEKYIEYKSGIIEEIYKKCSI